MPLFKRKIEEKIARYIGKGKVLLIFGPRQAGKTTLAKKLLAQYGDADSYFNCEEMSVRRHFSVGEPEMLRSFIGTRKLVVFDEAQTIENIGIILKVFVDKYSDTQIIATGSSSFDLANKINEPLTGRAFSFTLLPLSIEEIRSEKQMDRNALEGLLRFGSYPAVVAAHSTEEKLDVIGNIATNYLYKDIFTFERIKSPLHFEQLLRLLAHQVGSTVSLNEIALSLSVSRPVVEKYLRLLEQSYVIRRVPSFSRNKRNEIRKAFKVFFIDSGIRNAIIGDFSEAGKRPDIGHLFEQFFFTELMKASPPEMFGPGISFWRTHKKEEVDFVTEHAGSIHAYECKWGDGKVSFRPFLKAYPDAQTQVVRPETLLS